LLPFLVAILLPGLAGCDHAPAGPVHVVATARAAPAALPEDLHLNGTIGPGFDPVSSGRPACSPAGSCSRTPFHLDGNASVTARLSWLSPGDDLDLYLVQGGAVVDMSNTFASRIEALHARVGSGDYEIVVAGSTTGGASFALDVWFDPAAAPNP
jgi:hypothetical protein